MSSSLESSPLPAANLEQTASETTASPYAHSECSPIVSLPSSVSPHSSQRAGFVPSERPQDCAICRRGLTQNGQPDNAFPSCTIPSHFLNHSMDQTPTTSSSQQISEPVEMTSPDLSLDQTFSELVKRMRGLLSRQNVSIDPSIALLMVGAPWGFPDESKVTNNDLYITVDALMSHPFIGVLKTSKKTILKAAETVGSHVLRVEQETERIYPIMKAERSTLILRNLEASAQELRQLIVQAPSLQKYTDAEAIREMRKEMVGGQINWFVTLPSAADATETALWLRNQKYQNQDIKVGVKSESEFQSFMSRPMPTWNMEGAFVPPVAMHYALDSKGRLRRGGMSRGRVGGRGRARGGNSRRNWQEAGPVGGEASRTRGGRGVPRGRARGSRRGGRSSDWYENGNRDDMVIVNDASNLLDEVDPTEFPPLMESAKVPNFGYGSREFKQYSPTTLRELRDQVHNSTAEVAI